MVQRPDEDQDKLEPTRSAKADLVVARILLVVSMAC